MLLFYMRRQNIDNLCFGLYMIILIIKLKNEPNVYCISLLKKTPFSLTAKRAPLALIFFVIVVKGSNVPFGE
jgi:hypothetical protein